MINTKSKIIFNISFLLFLFSSDNYSQNILYNHYRPLIDRTKSIISKKDIDIQLICDSIKLNDSIHSKNEDANLRFYQILDRKLECGLRQLYFAKLQFYINFLFDNDTIVFISFDNYYDLGTLFEYLDKNRFQSFIKIHESIYNVKINSIDELLLPFQLQQFGTFCGIVGEPTDLGRSMIESVKKKRYKMLKKWSLSMSPEIQAYGVIGLLFLRVRGYKLQCDDLANIYHIQNLSLPLYTCNGCQYFIEPMNKELSDENIMIYLYQYTKCNYLGECD